MEAFPTLVVKGDESDWRILSSIDQKRLLRRFVEESICTRSYVDEKSNRIKWLPHRACVQHVMWTFDMAKKYTRRTELVSWLSIHKRMSSKVTVNKKNVDVRVGWRWKNIFLVKVHFTFGLRRPPKGTVNFIQTDAVPILIFFPKQTRAIAKMQDRTFPWSEQRLFTAHVLKANCVYIVPTEQPYILLTTQKTLFALDRVESKTSFKIREKIDIPFRNALHALKWSANY